MRRKTANSAVATAEDRPPHPPEKQVFTDEYIIVVPRACRSGAGHVTFRRFHFSPLGAPQRAPVFARDGMKRGLMAEVITAAPAETGMRPYVAPEETRPELTL